MLKSDEEEVAGSSKLADQTLEKLEYMLELKQMYYNEGKRADSPEAQST